MMISLLRNIWNGLTSKVRLWIEYALIAGVVILGGMALTLHFQAQRQQADINALKGRVKSVEDVNQQQADTIGQLQDLRNLDAKALAALSQDQKANTRKSVKLQQRINELERTNAKVRDYLSSPVPVDLQCVLDNTCPTDKRAAAGDGGTARDAVRPVPASGASANAGNKGSGRK